MRKTLNIYESFRVEKFFIRLFFPTFHTHVEQHHSWIESELIKRQGVKTDFM